MVKVVFLHLRNFAKVFQPLLTTSRLNNIVNAFERKRAGYLFFLNGFDCTTHEILLLIITCYILLTQHNTTVAVNFESCISIFIF
jgi:hypothetical protein